VGHHAIARQPETRSSLFTRIFAAVFVLHETGVPIGIKFDLGIVHQETEGCLLA